MPTPTLNRAQFEARREKFELWLAERGAEVLSPTNEWELLRFKTEKGTGIVYTNKRAELTWMGPAAEAYLAHVGNKSWRAVPKEQRRRKSSVVCQALRDRDGDDCFFCHLPVAIEEESPEHLVSITHGGPDHIANMALAHRVCNHQAGHLSLMGKIRMREEALVRLYTPGALPRLLLPPEAAVAVEQIAAEMNETPPWSTP
jgi:hypothetical protein